MYHLKRMGIHRRSFSEASKRQWEDESFRKRHKESMIGKRSSPKGRIWRLKRRKYCPSIKGDKNPNWKGGSTRLNQSIRGLPEYAVWRMEVFRRDGWMCQECGAKNQAGKKYVFDADHIIPLHKLISENQITTIDDAISCSHLWSISNGRCLCRQCHKETESWGPNAAKNIKAFALHPQNKSLGRDTPESTLEEIGH